jgi:protein-L-isoaspartate(D-aspartate) O-methyltransferase
MNFAQAREQMVEEQLQARGIHDQRVLAAMRRVPRHLFVESALQWRAYDDTPLPIGQDQTISQPYMVALMSEVLELKGYERVLEIGTGSGYQTAVLAELAREVFSIERIESLTCCARACLETLGYGDRVHLRTADGSEGWPEAAPFDGIMITAAVLQIPRPLVEQLAERGYLVLPLGEAELQGLTRLEKRGERLDVNYFGECRFVKMIGPYGWEG